MAIKITKRSLSTAQLRSLLDNSTVVDDEKRTVELIWSTGFKGLRRGWETNYYEELSMKPEDVDMSRLQAGAPVLASHDSYSLGSVIGVVERAWIENGVGKASVRFSTDPDADKIYQKVKEKILRNVSVGYDVKKYEKVSGGQEEIPTYRATKWQPMEISIVAMGFDPGAQVRKNENVCEVEIEENEEEILTVTEVTPKEQRMTEAEKKALEAEIKKQAQAEEKARQTEIRSAVRAAKLEESFADGLIDNNVTADEARKQVLAKLVEKQAEPINNTTRVETGSDNQSKRVEMFESALLHRMDPRNFKIEEDAKSLYGKGLIRQLESIVPRRMMESDAQYAKRAMASSDLPLALANVAEKSLQKQYELQPRTFAKWTRPDSLRNYKEHSQVKTGDFSSLVERPENAEFEIGSFGEKNEVAQLKDYGKIHSFSSQMLVNDDLGVLNRMASSSGIAVSRLENRLAYLALTTNKTMKDGVVLYHATHANLGSAGAISATTVAEAYKLMRKQMSTDGLDNLNLYPKFFVCGPDQESTARQFFASVNAAQTSNVNIYSGTMEVIVDGQLTGNQYYFLSDPNVVDTVVCYRLEGQEQPGIQSRINFSTDSLDLKIAHAFAAAPMDWRGIVKNAGQ